MVMPCHAFIFMVMNRRCSFRYLYWCSGKVGRHRALVPYGPSLSVYSASIGEAELTSVEIAPDAPDVGQSDVPGLHCFPTQRLLAQLANPAQ
jgi:hypothetical protein